jgi:hypothetical protein
VELDLKRARGLKKLAILVFTSSRACFRSTRPYQDQHESSDRADSTFQAIKSRTGKVTEKVENDMDVSDSDDVFGLSATNPTTTIAHRLPRHL